MRDRDSRYPLLRAARPGLENRICANLAGERREMRRVSQARCERHWAEGHRSAKFAHRRRDCRPQVPLAFRRRQLSLLRQFRPDLLPLQECRSARSRGAYLHSFRTEDLAGSLMHGSIDRGSTLEADAHAAEWPPRLAGYGLPHGNPGPQDRGCNRGARCHTHGMIVYEESKGSRFRHGPCSLQTAQADKARRESTSLRLQSCPRAFAPFRAM